MNSQTKQSKGFTIIEVVLVLAIAALIFLMVFIALPALQANQRDTARKSDASTVAAAVQSFVSNERRALQVSDVDKLRSYIESLDQYNAESADTIQVEDTLAAGEDVTVDEDQINVYLENKCDGTTVKDGVDRSAAVFVKLEGSGGSVYCVDV